ncbi:hypothetical protein AB0K18_08605 [Nonomuraea sp. NPDC049421]
MRWRAALPLPSGSPAGGGDASPDPELFTLLAARRGWGDST